MSIEHEMTEARRLEWVAGDAEFGRHAQPEWSLPVWQHTSMGSSAVLVAESIFY